MTLKTVINILELNESVSEDMQDYVEEYADWVKDNIDQEYWKYFGIAYFINSSRLGYVLGFINSEDEVCPLNWDKSYYFGGDFDYPVSITTKSDTYTFAKSIPSILEKGLDKIETLTKVYRDIMENKIDFSKIVK